MTLPPYRQLKRIEIKIAVEKKAWQKYRLNMKGKTTEEKKLALEVWYDSARNKDIACVQVINCLNALKRGGLIK